MAALNVGTDNKKMCSAPTAPNANITTMSPIYKDTSPPVALSEVVLHCDSCVITIFRCLGVG